MTLRALREAQGLTQGQVQKASGISQPEISKLEGAASLDDRMVATVRRYLGALGDDLDLVAVSKYGHRVGVAGANAGEPSPDDSVAPTFNEELRRLAARAWEKARRSGTRKDIVISEALDDACLFETRGGRGPGSGAFASAVHRYHGTTNRVDIAKRDERVTPRSLLAPPEWLPRLRDRADVLLKIISAHASTKPLVAKSLTLDAGAVVPGLRPEDQPIAETKLAQRLAAKMPTDAAELVRWTLDAFNKDSAWVNRAEASERKAKSRAFARKKRPPRAKA